MPAAQDNLWVERASLSFTLPLCFMGFTKETVWKLCDECNRMGHGVRRNGASAHLSCNYSSVSLIPVYKALGAVLSHTQTPVSHGSLWQNAKCWIKFSERGSWEDWGGT